MPRASMCKEDSSCIANRDMNESQIDVVPERVVRSSVRQTLIDGSSIVPGHLCRRVRLQPTSRASLQPSSYDDRVFQHASVAERFYCDTSISVSMQLREITGKIQCTSARLSGSYTF